MKTSKDPGNRAFTDAKTLELAAIDSADDQSSKVEGQRQSGELRELILGLALILCLFLLEATAFGSFLDRLAHGTVEKSANVFWVQSRNGL